MSMRREMILDRVRSVCREVMPVMNTDLHQELIGAVKKLDCIRDAELIKALLRQCCAPKPTIVTPLTKSQIDAMIAIRDGRPFRAVGSIKSMLNRLRDLGMVEGPPYECTPLGLDCIAGAQ